MNLLWCIELNIGSNLLEAHDILSATWFIALIPNYGATLLQRHALILQPSMDDKCYNIFHNNMYIIYYIWCICWWCYLYMTGGYMAIMTLY